MGLKLVGQITAAMLALGAAASAGQAFGQAYGPRVEKVLTYTVNGRVKTEADGKGNLTTYEYDGLDRLVKVRYPDPNTPGGSSTSDYEQYGYDAAGNRTSWRRRSGETVTFTYDALNRAQNGLRGEAYTYDNLGRRTNAAYNGYTHEAVYDALGRMTIDRTNNLTMSYAYDLAGRRTRVTWNDGFYVTYDHNVAGDLTAIRENGGAALASYLHDDLGRVTSRAYANGVETGYAYDAASRLSQLNLNVAGTDKDQAWTFAYNAASQVVSRTAANGLYEWTELQASKTYGVNGLNQLTSVGAQAVSYDLRGNLSVNAGVSHGYDLANNLTATSAGAVLAYEPTGRLWQVSAGGTTTQFLYSGSDLVAEYGSSGLLRRYVPGEGVDQPLVWYEGAGASDRRFLLQDAQGSVVAVTSGAGVATINTYDEYGVPAATNDGLFQYTGQIWLKQVGLYHYKARAYSPTLGRFLQTDPIGYGDGMNWYAYVGNDPTNATDPDGMLSWTSTTTCAPYSGEGDGVSGGYCQTTFSSSGGDDSLSGALQRAVTNYFTPSNGASCGAAVLGGAAIGGSAGAVAGGITGGVVGAGAGGGVFSLGTAPAGALAGANLGGQAGTVLGGFGGWLTSPSCHSNTASGDGSGGGGQPASEKRAVDFAKRIERDLGKNARRDFHDMKAPGEGDRSLSQLKEDARAIYQEYGKAVPSWAQ